MFEIFSIESNSYAHLKYGIVLNSSPSEIEQLIGLLMYTGVCKMPNTNMYWSAESRFPPIAYTMTRNRFRDLMKYFHINDNEKQKQLGDSLYDKLHKVRPLLDSLLQSLQQIVPEEYQSVDEQMIPFKGRSSLKQYIRSKPHKWGYKVFMRAGASGIMYDFRVYVGKGTCSEVGLGFSGDIVMTLCETLLDGQNFKLCFDNWFSSLQLCIALKEKQIFSLGTIRADRMAKCPLETKMQKKGRGSVDWRVETTENLALVRWFDRKEINFISSYAAVNPQGTC